MKMRVLFFVIVTFVFAPPSVAEDSAPLSGGLQTIERLTGRWGGVGDGLWGTSAIERAYAPFLQGKFIKGNGRSIYPKQARNPDSEIHRSMDIYSYDAAKKIIVRREFDNEGFVALYHLDLSQGDSDTFIFVSRVMENVPPGWKARLKIHFADDDNIEETFELDTDGKGFKLYLTNLLHRLP